MEKVLRKWEFFFLLNGTNSRFFLFHFSLHVVITTFYSCHRFSSSLFEWGSMTITIISLRGGGGGGYSNSYHFLQNFNANVNKFGYCRQVHLPLSSFLACFFFAPSFVHGRYKKMTLKRLLVCKMMQFCSLSQFSPKRKREEKKISRLNGNCIQLHVNCYIFFFFFSALQFCIL